MEKDREILQLFPTFLHREQLGGNSKEGMNSCLEVLKIAAFQGHVTQYDLIKKTRLQKQKRLVNGVATARDCLQKLEYIGLLKVEVKPGKKGRPRKESSLTTKGVIACLMFHEFQTTEKMQTLLNDDQFRGNKLAALLRIYNEGYAERALLPLKSVVSPCLEIVKRLIISQEGLNVETASEEKLIQKLRAAVDERFLARVRRKQSVDQWMLLSIQNSDFLKNLTDLSESSRDLQPEEMQEGINQGIHTLVVMSSPELLAWTVHHKRADMQLSLKRLKGSISARTADCSTPFDGPQDVLDRSLDAMRDLMLEELSQS
jgi:hypothetical protein